jgi:hypothetical protein
MRIIFSVGILLVAAITASAQKKDTTRFKPHYYGMFLNGAQVGCSNCDLDNKVTVSAYFINGVQLSKRFSTGIGVGFDSYEQWKTMPVFLHLSEKVIGRKNGLSVQLNGGYAFAWMDKQEYEMPNFKQDGGLMVHYALAYHYELEKIRLLFSVGMKRQNVSYSYRYNWSQQFNQTKNSQELNRFVFQVGFGWK